MDFAGSIIAMNGTACRTRAWNVAPFNVKIGLLNNVDLQLVFDDYLRLRTEDRSTHTVRIQSGVGDFTPRLRVNLWEQWRTNCPGDLIVRKVSDQHY